VCIVTGAGSGIGRATAVRLAEEGGLVTCVDVNGDAVAGTVASIGDAAYAVTADVSDDAQVRAYTDDTVTRWGKLDVAFNNAGVNLPTVFHEAPDDLIDRTIAVNLKGVIHGCRAAIPHMLAQGGGSIINTGSVNSLVSEPFLSIYAATKGAILMLSRSIALDYALQLPVPRLGRHAGQLRARGDAGGARPRLRHDRLVPTDRPSWRTAGDRERRAVPGERRIVVHDRERGRRRRRDDGAVAAGPTAAGGTAGTCRARSAGSRTR